MSVPVTNPKTGEIILPLAKSETLANTVSAKLSLPAYKKRFEEVLGKKAPAFISSIISAVKMNKELKNCDPDSVIGSAMIAATLDLPINPSLGFAHIVPYGGVAQFQMGWKGFNQLGLRSGQMVRMNAAVIYEGELVKWDRITGDLVADESKRTSEKIVGYVSYFRLANGYEHYYYMTKEEVVKHALKYSRSYANPKAAWQTQFDAMALKTVHKQNLSKWAPMTSDLELALRIDQGVLRKESQILSADIQEVEIEYLDNENAGRGKSTEAGDEKLAAAPETSKNRGGRPPGSKNRPKEDVPEAAPMLDPEYGELVQQIALHTKQEFDDVRLTIESGRAREKWLPEAKERLNDILDREIAEQGGQASLV